MFENIDSMSIMVAVIQEWYVLDPLVLGQLVKMFFRCRVRTSHPGGHDTSGKKERYVYDSHAS